MSAKASRRVAAELACALGKLYVLDGVVARDADDSLWLIHSSSRELPARANDLLTLERLDNAIQLARRWATHAERIDPARLGEVRQALGRLRSGRRAQHLADRGVAPLRRYVGIPQYVARARRRCARIQRWLHRDERPPRVGPGLDIIPPEPLLADLVPRGVVAERMRPHLMAIRKAVAAVAALTHSRVARRAWRQLCAAFEAQEAPDPKRILALLVVRLQAVLAAPETDVALPPEASATWLRGAVNALERLTAGHARAVWAHVCADATGTFPNVSLLEAPLPVVEVLAQHGFPWTPSKALNDAATARRYVALEQSLQEWMGLDDPDEAALALAMERPSAAEKLDALRAVRDALSAGTPLDRVRAALSEAGPGATPIVALITRWVDARVPSARPVRFVEVCSGLQVPPHVADAYLAHRELSGHGPSFSKILVKALRFPEHQRAKHWKRARNAFRRSRERFATSGLRECFDRTINQRARALFGRRLAEDSGLVDIMTGLVGADDLPRQTLGAFARQLTEPRPLTSLPPNDRWTKAARKRGLPVDSWLAGFNTTITVGGKSFAVRTGTSSREYAHMGSHFGTCLSLHTGCYRSAVPINALDANKQLVIVTACGGGGDWVARKLIAVAQRDRLVGYTLYTNGDAPEGLEAAVNAAIGSFAERLGLPLARRGSVEQLHEGEWLDDGTVAWSHPSAARCVDDAGLRNAVDARDGDALRRIVEFDAGDRVLKQAALFHLLRLQPSSSVPCIRSPTRVVTALTAIGRLGTARRLSEATAMDRGEAMSAMLLGLPSKRVGRAVKELRRLKALETGRVVARPSSWHAQLPLEQLLRLFGAAGEVFPRLVRGEPAPIVRGWASLVRIAADRDDAWRVLRRRRLLAPRLRAVLEDALNTEDGSAAVFFGPDPLVRACWGDAAGVEVALEPFADEPDALAARRREVSLFAVSRPGTAEAPGETPAPGRSSD